MGNHYIFCISGYSGSGKDEFANRLIQKYNTVKIGLADAAKRHMADLYDFTEEQLFGPSAFRNKGDLRYPKNTLDAFNFRDFGIEEGDPKYWLSPREALQLYCEQMNELYLNTWIEKGIRVHQEIASNKINHYYPMYGVRGGPPREDNEFGVFTCCCDFRHKHEINTIRAKAKTDGFIPVIVRVKREGLDSPPFDHRSEVEQSTINDDSFDFIVQNDGKDLEAYHAKASNIVSIVTSGSFTPKLDVKV